MVVNARQVLLSIGAYTSECRGFLGEVDLRTPRIGNHKNAHGIQSTWFAFVTCDYCGVWILLSREHVGVVGVCPFEVGVLET